MVVLCWTQTVNWNLLFCSLTSFQKKSIWVWRLCIIVTYSSFLGVSMCRTVLCSTIIRGHSYCTYLRNSNFGCPKWNGNSKNIAITSLPIKSFLISTLNFKTPFLNVPSLLSIELLLVNKAQLQQSSGAARTYLGKPVCILHCGSIPLMCKYCNDVKCRCHHFRGLSSHEQYMPAWAIHSLDWGCSSALDS